MIHYHGTPMTPTDDMVKAFAMRHAMVSFENPQQIAIACEVCQSVVLDNGAFSAWTKEKPYDFDGFAAWVEAWIRHPAVEWCVIPDKIDDDAAGGKQRFGVFGTTVVAFFLAEMGDKTQIATVALAARYTDIVQVVLGTTFGMMLANVPAVFLGDKIAKKVSMKLVHGIAAVIFAILGVLTLLNVGKLF